MYMSNQTCEFELDLFVCIVLGCIRVSRERDRNVRIFTDIEVWIYVLKKTKFLFQFRSSIVVRCTRHSTALLQANSTHEFTIYAPEQEVLAISKIRDLRRLNPEQSNVSLSGEHKKTLHH